MCLYASRLHGLAENSIDLRAFLNNIRLGVRALSDLLLSRGDYGGIIYSSLNGSKTQMNISSMC